jgi:hypothetical protein
MSSTNRTALPLLGLLLFCAGCLKSTRDFVINPDGSGRVVVEETTPNLAKMFDPEAKKGTSKEELRKFAAKVIGDSRGIELWRDVTYKTLPDGRIYFKGTAYFRDYNDLHFEVLANNDFRIDRAGDGTVTLFLPEKQKEGGDSTAPPPTTDAEIRHVADSLRASFGEARTLLASVSDIYEHDTYRFAGSVKSSRGFRREADGALGVEFDGKALLRVLDSVTATEGFWERAARREPGSEPDARVLAALFGGAMPSADVAISTSPLFDYADEVAAGRREYAALRKKLGLK